MVDEYTIKNETLNVFSAELSHLFLLILCLGLLFYTECKNPLWVYFGNVELFYNFM